MTRFKVLLTVGCLLAASLIAGQAQAVVVPSPFSTTLGGWAGDVVIQQQDKIWTFIDTTLPLDTGAIFNTVVLPAEDVHTLHLDFTTLPGGILAPGDYALHYTIAIDQIISPGFTFKDAALDSDVPTDAATATIVKTLTPGGLLTSIGGAPDGPNVFPAGTTLVDVSETFHVEANGIVTGTTNTFTELNPRPIPEPATLVIWSVLGALGLGLAWRRRK